MSSAVGDGADSPAGFRSRSGDRHSVAPGVAPEAAQANTDQWPDKAEHAGERRQLLAVPLAQARYIEHYEQEVRKFREAYERRNCARRKSVARSRAIGRRAVREVSRATAAAIPTR